MIKYPLYYFTKAVFHIQREGLIAFIKQLFSSLKDKVFLYQEHYIFQKDLNNLNTTESERFAPKVKGYDFKVISAKEEVCELLERGFSINPPFSIDSFYERLVQGQIAFCIFVGKDLAYSSWAVLNNNVRIHPPLKNINYDKEAYLVYDVTSPKYRRLGLHTYGSIRRFEYLKEMGKTRGILTVLKNNELAIRTQRKLGSEICGEGKYLRLFKWTFWKKKTL
jgi:ribosomal protein S18 acetylase RimI-like enzyme